ncbi:MAG: hypothetical protein QXU45_07965 [Candidatus Bathyarchaeia archaeon]
MKTKTKGGKRAYSKRKIAIASIIAVMVTIITISTIRQRTENTTNPKKDPNEYFQFLDVSAFGTRVSQNVVRIQSLSLTVKPVSGDAHNFAITGLPINYENYWRAEIKNGTEEHFEIELQYQIQLYKKANGYSIKLHIRSDESEGDVTLWLKDEDIITYE